MEHEVELRASDVLPAAHGAHVSTEPLSESTRPASHTHHEVAFARGKVWLNPSPQSHAKTSFCDEAADDEPAGHGRHADVVVS